MDLTCFRIAIKFYFLGLKCQGIDKFIPFRLNIKMEIGTKKNINIIKNVKVAAAPGDIPDLGVTFAGWKQALLSKRIF